MTDTITLQGPANAGGFSHDGIAYDADENGCISVPPELTPLAAAHGFHAARPDDAQVDLSKLTKKQLLAFAKDALDADLDEKKTNKELVAEIEAALQAGA